MPFRKIIFWSHLGVGVGAGLIILSMCATGLVLAFEPQIVDFAERGVRFVPFPDPAAQRLDVETLLARAVEGSPRAVPSGLSLESAPTAAAVVRLGKDGAVYVNPYTGAVLGKESKVHSALHTVEEWHRWLGSKNIGKPITGAGAIAFLGLSLSGIYLWWPSASAKATADKIRGSIRFRSGLTGKARDWNWHTVTGFWFSLYFVLITTTGIVMSYTWASNLLYTLTGNQPPPVERRAASPGPEKGKEEREARVPFFSGLNALWAKAEQQVPGWTSIALRIPPKPGAPLTFFILDAGSGRSKARSQLTLDPRTGETTKWEPYQNANLGRRLRMWVKPLHTGQAWGWPGQTLNFFAAGAGLLLIYTGFALAWRRFRT